MTRNTILSLILAVCTIPAFALKPGKDPVKFAVGVHAGIDIGGAVPYPPGKAIGGQNKMSATPRLTPALGLSYTTMFDRHWSAVVESTYKTVALDARTWVEQQGMRDPDDGTWQYFRGRADASMSFSMLEIPLYVRYSFGDGTNKVFLGGYYARVFKGKFETTPGPGMATPTPGDDKTWSVVNKGDMGTRNFDNGLDKWDAGIIVGYERRIINRVNLSGRFSAGFKDVFRRDSRYLEYAMFHMRGTLMLSYMFMRK